MYKYREGNGGRISILVPTKKGLEDFRRESSFQSGMHMSREEQKKWPKL